MKISKGNMAHRVMTLLKMALRELRAGKDDVGSAKVLVLSHDWSVTKDIFWDSSRRFVKYCGVCRGWVLGPLSLSVPKGTEPDLESLGDMSFGA